METQAIKLSEAISKTELNMNDLFKRIDVAINSRKRKTKVETLLNKAKTCWHQQLKKTIN